MKRLQSFWRKLKLNSLQKQTLLAGVGLLILAGGIISAIWILIANLSPFSVQLTCVLPLLLFLTALIGSAITAQVMFKSVGCPDEESEFQKNEKKLSEVL